MKELIILISAVVLLGIIALVILKGKRKSKNLPEESARDKVFNIVAGVKGVSLEDINEDTVLGDEQYLIMVRVAFECSRNIHSTPTTTVGQLLAQVVWDRPIASSPCESWRSFLNLSF